MSVLVSVVIPSYNYGRFLAEAIASVQGQTVEDLEIIVVDDGSTDETPDVLARISEPRLRAIRIANSGISGARNAGLELARGEFLAFLDADDRWLPHKLERQLGMFASEPSLGLVFSDFRRFDGDRTFPKTQFDFIPDLAALSTRRLGSGGQIIEDDTFIALTGLGQFATWLQTVMLRRSLVADLRFPPREVVNEDLHYMARAYLRVRAGYIPEPLVEVRRHGNNSYQQAFEKTEPHATALELLLGEPMTAAQRAALRRRIGRAWIAVAYQHFWFGRARDVARASLRSLRYPGNILSAAKHLAALPVRPFLPRRPPPV